MKKIITSVAFISALLISCGENKKTDIVASGTYKGKAEEVDKDEKEIYVRTADNKLLELYFTDATKVTRDGTEVEFDQLREGGQVEVSLTKKGNRLEPVSVAILD